MPGSTWVHLPVTMGYDRYPELLIEEKKALLDYAIANQCQLFFTHDPKVASSLVEQNEKGRYSLVPTC